MVSRTNMTRLISYTKATVPKMEKKFAFSWVTCGHNPITQTEWSCQMKLSLLCHYEIRLFFYRVAVTLNWIRKELPCFTSTMNRKNKESNISKSTQELETQFEYIKAALSSFLREFWCRKKLLSFHLMQIRIKLQCDLN